MLKNIRIGLPMIGSKYWYAGVTVVESIISSVAQLSEENRPQLFLVMNDENLECLTLYDLIPLHEHLFPLIDGLIYVGTNIDTAKDLINHPIIHYVSTDHLFHNIDLMLPINSELYPGYPAIPWIPDFQHHYLPQLFSATEITKRNTLFQKIADNSPVVLFTSNDAKKDFLQLYPSSPATPLVLPFPVHPKKEWYTGDPYQIQAKYKIPDRFILCSNQFWMHKNHPVLFKALAILQSRGQEIHLVCTGSTTDYRNPNYFNKLQEYIQVLNLKEHIHILGLIPRHDQMQLMRRSLFVVQPSLFEGLSLIIQECQLLGKDIILSDLPIHEEEGYGTYFARTDAEDLANKISLLLPTTNPGPDLLKENESKLEYNAKITNFNWQFCQFIMAAREIYRSPVQNTTFSHSSFHHDKITIATSLAPGKDISTQKKAIESWMHSGFNVVSINSQAEINTIQPYFPNIEFVAAKRDARETYGKPYIYIDDILAYFAARENRICGIVNSDIHFFKKDLPAFMNIEATDSLVFGPRLDVESFDKISNGIFYKGFDYFFFDRSFIQQYPPAKFCIGLPWWDYWMPLIPLLAKLSVKKVTTPICYHIIHPSNYSIASWKSLALEMMKHFSLPPQANEIYLGYLNNYILDLIEKTSTSIEYRMN
ncbi:glycosyltransferase [Pelosinus propionicus]|uniref:Glycosyltransferase involved in cell wall bisynthesis n=1 Tax=Pelosinus propionicus DSM 13327 TaxID=1123291 RepID=A0A1I4JRT3_9FIRM|nr:glycosyltransferase [Pelosinus propionicus]SFL68826.1 Glycosyltransferase involved in cell wall bisynthesis [Pelosinus propionicus DSM 13327]